MGFDAVALADALTAVARGRASFETRAALEHALLVALQRSGIPAVASMLESQTTYTFTQADAPADADPGTGDTRFEAGAPAGRLVVSAFRSSHTASVNVALETRSPTPPTPDPRHEAFYAIWETLLQVDDAEGGRLDGPHRAVFLVGRLESDVMNGGLGQYLVNSDGRDVEETVTLLRTIGAAASADLLARAAALRSAGESFDEVWSAKTAELERLDQRWLEAGEDLAGRVADTWLTGSRSGPNTNERRRE